MMINSLLLGRRTRALGRRAFTLIELLVVIGILAVLAAILFPVYARVREKGRATRCLANLKQLGEAMRMYMDDYDGYYPWGVDIADKYRPEIWRDFPYWQAQIPDMPLLHELLDPYIKSHELWHCPSDKGFDELEDAGGVPLPARPCAYETLGASYMYRTELTFRRAMQEHLADPAAINVFFDGSGTWHGEEDWSRRRWNVLYADGHLKTANRGQYDRAWNTSLF